MIVLPIIFNILAVVGFYLLEKKTKFERLSYIKKQLIIGVIFGLIAISSSELGIVKTVKGTSAIMNVRDASPISAGLIFGPIAGVVAGALGGGYRAISALWVPSRMDTLLACSISTFLAGIVSAILRKYMFDDKKPTITYALSIALVIEVFHMLMLFITNLNDVNRAFTIVKICTIPMCLLNAITVAVSVLMVTLLSKEKIRKGKGKEQIAQTFQRWLVISILIAFIGTSIFTNNLQTDMRRTQLEETFKSTMIDVIKDIEGKSNSNLLSKAKEVKKRYTDPLNTLSLNQIAESVGVVEINIVDSVGKITQSTADYLIGFDMANDGGDQAKEFMQLVNAQEEKTVVQAYGKVGGESGDYRKFAGISLENGGFIQVGYNEVQFRKNLDEYVIDFTKNRSVGANGFVAVCDENLNLITETKRDGWHISKIGIEPNSEMLAKESASKIYNTNIINEETDYNEEHIYVFTFIEGYCIIVAMPEADAYLVRDASIYLSVFMQIIVFGTLFLVLYFLIKRLVIDNILKINGTLSKISSGNLNETVEVRSNVEFASLSDDINTTVDTLKRYIKEAAQRIDKELEYAKQIQLSVLPKNFPVEDNYEVYADMIAAKEVGGDFYDFYKINDDNVAILVADVSGKGIPAAMFMMTAKTVIKDLAERGLAVNEILTLANEKLCENNESGMFVTAWMGILNTSNGVLTFANAGHNPPLLKKDGKFIYLKSRSGLVLAGMEGVKYRLNEIQLTAGDRILLYTDGVTEATDENNKLYGEERLAEFMNNNASASVTDLLPMIKSDIDLFVGNAPQFDDITMLVLDYKNNKLSGNTTNKVFPADTNALPSLLEFVEERLQAYNCATKTTMALCVAIEEVFVNVAHYAYGDSQGDVKFSITFNQSTREIVFEMADKGKPFNPLLKADPDVSLSLEERQIGGLGIFITKKTMDKLTYKYEDGENVLIMTKRI